MTHLQNLLNSLNNDPHLSRTFEGSIADGKIRGSYSSLALINGLVIGYVRVEGSYEEDGELNIKTKPNWLFTIVYVFLVVLFGFAAISNYDDDLIFAVTVLFLGAVTILFPLIYWLESRRFLKNVERVLGVLRGGSLRRRA